MTEGSRPNCRCQSWSPIRATRVAPRRSSAAVKIRPRTGRTPRARNHPDDTNALRTACWLESFAIVVRLPGHRNEYPISAKLCDRARQSAKSARVTRSCSSPFCGWRDQTATIRPGLG